MSRVELINPNMKAHHVSLLSRWSAVPGSTVHANLLESVIFISQALAPPYSFPTIFHCDRLHEESVSSVVIQLLEVVVWHLSSARCSDKLVQGLRFIYNSHCDIWCASSGKYFPRSFQLLLCVVSTCLYLLEVRVLALQGKRKRRRAHKMSKALPLLITQFLNRPAKLADECQVMQLINFLQMQLVAIFGDASMKHQALIYWMAKETETYAGRCNMSRSNRTWGAGMVYRWKEHIKLYGSHLYGTVSKKQCRHRYNLFLRHSPQNYPTTVAVSFSHRSTIAPLEAAFIGIFLPSTNNLEKTFGLQARSNLAKLHRIKNQRKRSSTRFRLLTQLDDQQRQKNLLATSHLLNKFPRELYTSSSVRCRCKRKL